jgi:hypothetical protein
LDKVTPLEYVQKSTQATEIMSVFFYHLYRKLVRKEANRTLEDMESKTKGEE